MSCSSAFHIVLVEPEIPPNTGNIGRLCLAAGAKLHLIEPLGFSLDSRSLKRAGLDYWSAVDLEIWPSLNEFLKFSQGKIRLFYLTTKSDRRYWNERFQPGDGFVFGRETKGLPESLLKANKDTCLTIPMRSGRSLNLANAAAIVLYEAIRQLESNHC